MCLLNILEYSFLPNLIILSVGVLYATSVDDKPVHVITQISVTITLFVTLVIIAYHTFNTVIKLLKARTNIKISAILKNKAANNLANNDGLKNVSLLHWINKSLIQLWNSQNHLLTNTLITIPLLSKATEPDCS